jgi:ferredoxin
LRICIDKARCIGVGMCEAVAPEVFAVQPDGNLELLSDSPGADQRAAVEEAISVCPTGAISVQDG